MPDDGNADEDDLARFERVADLLVAELRSAGLPGIVVRRRGRMGLKTDGWAEILATTARRGVSLGLWYDRYLGTGTDRRFSIWLVSGNASTLEKIAQSSGLPRRATRTKKDRSRSNLLRDAGTGWIGRWFIDTWPSEHYFGRYPERGHAGNGDAAIVQSLAIDAATLAHTTTPTAVSAAAPAFPRSDAATLALIERRTGQGAFRDAVVEAFSGRCVISGCEVTEVLEAAHIIPWSARRQQDPGAALLLRADLHTLFDCGLLTILKVKGVPTVRLDPRLRHVDPYGSYAGPLLGGDKLTESHWHALSERVRRHEA